MGDLLLLSAMSVVSITALAFLTTTRTRAWAPGRKVVVVHWLVGASIGVALCLGYPCLLLLLSTLGLVSAEHAQSVRSLWLSVFLPISWLSGISAFLLSYLLPALETRRNRRDRPSAKRGPAER